MRVRVKAFARIADFQRCEGTSEPRLSFWTWFLNALGVADAPERTERAGRTGAVAVLERNAQANGEGASWWTPEDGAAVDLTPLSVPTLSKAAVGLQNVLGTYFAAHDQKLPSLPHSAAKALATLNDPKGSVGAVATDIGHDPTLAAVVLRTANSAAYCGIERITSLPTAATRIGATVLRAVILRQSLQQLTVQRSGPFREHSERIWKRALASAAVMHTLAPLARLDRDAAYLVGLLCDIGSVAVLREAQEQDAIMRTRVSRTEFEFLCQQFHESLGRFIARSWSLPGNIQELIGSHHDWPAARDPHRTPKLLLRLTHMIVAVLGYGSDGPYDVLGSRAAGELGLAANAGAQAVLERVPDAIREHSSF